VAKPVQPTLLAVALARCEHQAEVPGFTGFEEAPLQGNKQGIGRADADKAGCRQRIARIDDLNSLLGCDQLVVHRLAPGDDLTRTAYATNKKAQPTKRLTQQTGT
jgi:hypothetical protein